MNLFKPIVPRERFHKNFASVLAPFRQAERDMFEAWADGFVDRDGKLVEEFQTTFNSTFWEIYLYAVFKECGFTIDWDHATPDFIVSSFNGDFAVEATTANAAQGKPNEWDREYSREELEFLRRFKSLNTEAIVRLSNAIIGKVKKYETTYKNLPYVKGKPFVIAIAPFEQPHFNHQHDRPIRALLYDHYVDEDAYLDNPKAYPDGPPSVNLGFVTKDNGTEIPLGLFNSPEIAEVSAVVFSCLATWGKLSAMSDNPMTEAIVDSLWATPPEGKPEKRRCVRSEYVESIRDGLQVYHNPFAINPLSPHVFRAPGVVQHYVDSVSGKWVFEGHTDALLFRLVHAHVKRNRVRLRQRCGVNLNKAWQKMRRWISNKKV